MINIGIIGTGQRAQAFINLDKCSKNAIVTHLFDNDRKRLEAFAKDCATRLKNIKLTSSLEEMLEYKDLQGIIITVPDKFHREVAEKCLAAGKNIMLEKPMASNTEDCRKIIRAQEKSGKLLQVGFILRNSPFYRKIKNILDKGTLGQVMSISAAEHLGLSHSASYMRRWHRKSENSGSFLLAKCSHDIDLLSWFTGSPATCVASFGDNNFFLHSKQPAEYCSNCPQVAECQFKFAGNYVYMTPEERANPSKYGFDMCVYNNDKDIVDNQLAIIEYANGIRANFSLQLFNPLGSNRSISITGSKAYLTGNLNKGVINIDYLDGNKQESINMKMNGLSGHGGGDVHFISEFIDSIKMGKRLDSNLYDGLASTVICNNIEKARISQQTVKINLREYTI